MIALSRPRCTLCLEMLEHEKNTSLQRCFLGLSDRRIIRRITSFSVIPTIGSLCVGYILIVPHRHVTTFAQLSLSELAELTLFMDEIQTIFQQTFAQSTLFFEHGLATSGSRRIEHAHLHAVPIDPDGFIQKVRGALGSERHLDHMTHLKEYTNRAEPYVFIHSRGDSFIFDAPPTESGHIHLRKLLANELEVPDLWDWAQHPGVANIRATVKQLKFWTKQGDV